MGDRDVCGAQARRAMALRVQSIDLDAGVIHVDRGWDVMEGEQEANGRNPRKVPIATARRGHLLAHLMRTGRRDDDLILGRTSTLPFDPHRVSDRADTAWAEAKLERITVHERHLMPGNEDQAADLLDAYLDTAAGVGA